MMRTTDHPPRTGRLRAMRRERRGFQEEARRADMATEQTSTPTPPALEAEVKRIVALRALPTTRGDAEDAYTYAREVVALRNSHTALVAALRPFARCEPGMPIEIADHDWIGLTFNGQAFAQVQARNIRHAAALSAEGEKDAPKDELSTLRTKLAEAEKALVIFQDVTPKAMKVLMFLGRDELLMADQLHRADALARTALSSIRGEDQ